MALEYKFVELSIVTDETIGEAVNAWVGRGWVLDGIRFVTTEASRRPQMAFISFTREVTSDTERAGLTSVRGGEQAPLTLAPEPEHEPEPEPDHVEHIDQTAPRRKGPRLVKADPDDERE